MNGLSQAAHRRAAVSLKGAAGLITLVVMMFLGGAIEASGQTASFAATTAVQEDVGSVTIKINYASVSASQDLIITYAAQPIGTAPADAQPGVDFSLVSGTFTISKGAPDGFRTFQIPILDDNIYQNTGADQMFNLTGTYSSGASTAMVVVTQAIQENDGVPVVSVNDASAVEGSGIVFTATLSHPQDAALTVAYTCSDLSASDPSDYSCPNSPFSFAALETSSQSTATTVEDGADPIYEGDEQFALNVTAAATYGIADGYGLGTVVDNETVPELSIADVTEPEDGDDPLAADVVGKLDFVITASHKSQLAYDISVSYLDGTAEVGPDYSATPQTVQMAAGTKTVALDVPINDDDLIEGVEFFLVNLVDRAEYDLHDGQAAGRILDNDGIDLAISATTTAGKNPAAAGLTGGSTTVIYEFLVENTNEADETASSVDVLFKLDGLTYVSSTVCVITATAQGFDCAVGSLAPGASATVEVTTTLSAAPGEIASIEALVTNGGLVDEDVDLKNNEERVLTEAVGVDFGDLDEGSAIWNTTLGSGGPRHLLTNDLYLGSSVDAETDGAPTAPADGDDSDADGDDEDGVVLFTADLLRGAADFDNYLAVTASESGYVSLFHSYDGVSFFNTVDDEPVSAGLNIVKMTLDGGITNTVLYVRARVCSVRDVCDTANGEAPNGEVEDYLFSVALYSSAAAPSVTLPAGVVEPVTAYLESGRFRLKDGNNMVFYDVSPPNSGTTVTINGNANPNTFVVEASAIDFNLSFHGQGGDDALEIRDSQNASDWKWTHSAINGHDGSVTLDGTGTNDFTASYYAFSPVLITLNATDGTFEFSDAINDDIIIRDNGSDVDGMSFVDSNGSEAVTFLNPTTTLKIYAGEGADTIDFRALDPSDGAGNPATAAISLFGFNNVATPGPFTDGPDTFLVAPLENTSSLSFAAIDGGYPDTCVGDVIDVNTTGGAVIDTIDQVTGSITFSSAHQALFLSNIEHYGDLIADVKLSLILPPSPATNPGDILPIQLLVENNGPATADCIKIDDVLLDGALTITDGPTFTQGSFNSPMWVVGSLAPGASATLSYEVEVGYQFNGEAAITALAPQEDPNLDNNSVSLDIQPAFPFPAKAQATAALWYDHDGDRDTDNRLMVGLANGYAGLTSAVLCRVPNFGGVFSDDLPLWRECGAGLPYPLYVTDLMQVETSDPDDKDLIYLTAWGSDGLYVSTDGGESFSAVNPNVSDTHVAGWTAVYAITEDADGFLYISTNHGFVFRSLNKGVSWQQIGSLPEVDADTPWSLTAHPTEGGRIYAGTFGRGVYTSDDYGFTWEFVGGKAVNDLLIAARGGHAFDLELDPTGDFLFVGTGKGVFRMSLDGVGAATGLWTSLDMEVDLNDGSTVTPEVRSLAFDMNGHLYATTWGFGAYRNPAPTLTPSIDFVKIALRGQEIAFVAISTDGSQVAFGSMGGGVEFVEALAASSTANESESLDSELPDGYVLNQNYPNPFNPVTTISFALPETGMARLAVYDVLGREVAVLVDGNLQAGQHSMQFDAQGLPTGTYIYRLETDKASFARQLVLMK